MPVMTTTSSEKHTKINSSSDLNNFRQFLNYPINNGDKPDKVGASSLSPIHAKLSPESSPK